MTTKIFNTNQIWVKR